MSFPKGRNVFFKPTVQSETHFDFVMARKRRPKANLQDKAQAEAVAPAARSAAVPVRHTAAPGAEVPAAATVHPVRARGWSLGIRLSGGTVFAIPVAASFPHVAAHVVEAQLVRRLCLHGMRLVAAVVIVPCHGA